MGRTRRARGGSDEAGTPATKALTLAGVEFTGHAYEHDPRAASYGIEAAQALGLDPETVFKTLVAQTDSPKDHGLVVAVVPVYRQLDLKALASAVGAKKAAMAEPSVVERTTGYVLGGVSPIGQKRALRTVLDASAQGLSIMYVSGGRRGFDIGLSPTALARVLGADFAPISR